MVVRLSNLLEVRASPDARYMCRVCGNRIRSGEQMIRLHYKNERAGYYSSYMHRRCRAAHLDCWLNEDTGKQFIMGVLDRLSDRALIDLGLRVEHEVPPAPEEPVTNFVLGHSVEPREPGSTSRLGLAYEMDWFGEVTRAPYNHSEHGRVMGVSWSRGPRVPWVVPPEEMQLRPVDMTDPDSDPEPEALNLEPRIGAQVRMINTMNIFRAGEVYTIVAGPRESTGSWGLGDPGIEEPYLHRVDSMREDPPRPGYWWMSPSRFEVVVEDPELVEVVVGAPDPDELDLTLRVGAQIRMTRTITPSSGEPFNEGEVYAVMNRNGTTSNWGIGERGAQPGCDHLTRERPGYWFINEADFEVVG